ncbi:hypothetical protein AUR64_18105 [Haloprofundus marisrubri]|uniref:Uncharacterized protein n=1 Tax=Haloprofundus marisrubri TaxID=1514971 RepID=A0A0W1R5Q5_9EURY|nr:hypothetical protein AUR64_18105 [Haloprofundus marisrubri]
MFAAPKRLHIMLFERSDARIDVFGHLEWSPYNPFAALWHTSAVGEWRSTRVFVEHIRNSASEELTI